MQRRHRMARFVLSGASKQLGCLDLRHAS
jgi:hypothetical protein